jgi:hypothetical protein
MARQLGRCHFSIVEELAGGRLASQWTETDHGLKISIALGPEDHPDDGHDVTLELLLCLGQALWTKLNHNQRKAWWLLLDWDICGGIAGEIDEEALKQKDCSSRGVTAPAATGIAVTDSRVTDRPAIGTLRYDTGGNIISAGRYRDANICHFDPAPRCARPARRSIASSRNAHDAFRRADLRQDW